MNHVIIPELFCPFPSSISPYAQAINDATIGWARRSQLLTENTAYHRLCAIGVGWLVGRTTPYTHLEGLQLLADWCTWLFLQDDQCDEQGIGKHPELLKAVHSRSLEILGGMQPTAQDNSAGHALYDLRQRMLGKGSDEWMVRFIQCVENSFDASVWEATNRAQGITPDVHSYIDKRASTSAMFTVLSLTEIADGIRLPKEVREHPTVQQLNLYAINAVCWANDIISLAKEIKQRDVHNLVLALRHQYHLPVKDAIYRAAALHDAQVRAFIDLQHRLPSFGEVVDADLNRYIDILRFWMRGNLDWASASGRYLEAVYGERHSPERITPNFSHYIELSA